MRLTQFSNYALRILQYTALKAPNRVRVEDIAKAHGISRHHLLKAVNRLSHEGFLDVTRGRGGGVLLARAPEDITVGDVVRITEAPITLVECFHAETNECPLIGVCRMQTGLVRAMNAFLNELDQITIAEAAGNKPELESRFLTGPGP